jgi:hypothetical protein
MFSIANEHQLIHRITLRLSSRMMRLWRGAVKLYRQVEKVLTQGHEWGKQERTQTEPIGMGNRKCEQMKMDLVTEQNSYVIRGQ